jgi:hypothetical protein
MQYAKRCNGLHWDCTSDLILMCAWCSWLSNLLLPFAICNGPCSLAGAKTPSHAPPRGKLMLAIQRITPISTGDVQLNLSWPSQIEHWACHCPVTACLHLPRNPMAGGQMICQTACQTNRLVVRCTQHSQAALGISLGMSPAVRCCAFATRAQVSVPLLIRPEVLAGQAMFTHQQNICLPCLLCSERGNSSCQC